LVVFERLKKGGEIMTKEQIEEEVAVLNLKLSANLYKIKMLENERGELEAERTSALLNLAEVERLLLKK
jgi:hypothetical protein